MVCTKEMEKRRKEEEEKKPRQAQNQKKMGFLDAPTEEQQIIVGICFGVAFLALLATLLYMYRRRKRQQIQPVFRLPNDTPNDEFVISSGSVRTPESARTGSLKRFDLPHPDGDFPDS